MAPGHNNENYYQLNRPELTVSVRTPANIMRFLNTLDPRLRGDDGLFALIVIPAQAGIQFVRLSEGTEAL